MSLLSLVLMLGMGIASFLYPYMHKKCSGTRLVIIFGVVMGISYLTFPTAGVFRENAALVMVLCSMAGFMTGVSCGVISSVMGAEFMKVVDQEHMARCGGVFNSLGSAAIPVTSALCSVLAIFCPVSVIFVACGALSVLLFICMAIRRMQFEAPKEA